MAMTETIENSVKTTHQHPVWAEVKVSQWGTTIIRYCKICGEIHTLKDPHAE